MIINVGRRRFVSLLGGAAIWPIAARAQERVRRIGVLINGSSSDPVLQSNVAGFVQGLADLKWIDGQNLRIDYRWNTGDSDRARAFAEELVALSPDVILAASTTNLIALQRATRTIPIVFTSVSDPVEQGFVPNLTHPGGNLTGFASFEFSIGGKWLDLLKQLAPSLARVAVVFHPETSSQSQFFLRSIKAAASKLHLEAIPTPIRDVAGFEPAFASLSRQSNGGLIFPTDSFTALHRESIVALAARYRLPAIYADPSFVGAGGLLVYGTANTAATLRAAATYVDRILRGTKAGDLPVQLGNKLKLTINLKAAKALGLDVPISLLLIADEQIE